MNEKQCKFCLQTKTLELFVKNARSQDGRTNKCKICTNEACKVFTRAYKSRNIDAIRKQQRDKYHKDIVLSREQNRIKYQSNKTKRAESSRTYAKANMEKRRVWDRAWRAAHLEYNKQKLADKRALLKNLTEIDRFVLKEAALLCEKRKKVLGGLWEIDHIKPVSLGGTSEAHNIQVVPKAWNAAKGNRNTNRFLG